MLLNPWVAAGGLVVVLSLWAADHSWQARTAALEEAGGLSVRIEQLTGHNNDLARALENRTELVVQLGLIGRDTQRVRDAITGQSALISQSLKELKRNDKAVADYLAIPVPAALGVRYARPATTNPVAWRAASTGVQPDAVPAAGSASGGAH